MPIPRNKGPTVTMFGTAPRQSSMFGEMPQRAAPSIFDDEAEQSILQRVLDALASHGDAMQERRAGRRQQAFYSPRPGSQGSMARGVADSLLDAATLPGDVYRGDVDPRSDEAIGRAFDLAGTVGAAGLKGVAETGAVLGTGVVRKLNTDAVAKRIAKQAEKLGFRVGVDSSRVSPSRYVSVEFGDGPGDPVFQKRIRISDHEPRSYYDEGELNVGDYGPDAASPQAALDWLAEEMRVLRGGSRPPVPPSQRWGTLSYEQRAQIDDIIRERGLAKSGTQEFADTRFRLMDELFGA